MEKKTRNYLTQHHCNYIVVQFPAQLSADQRFMPAVFLY